MRGGQEAVAEEIQRCLRARVSLIVLVTVEEQRALRLLDDVRRARGGDADLVLWDVADRFESKAGRRLADAGEAVGALDRIREWALSDPERRDVYVLKDFHEFWHKDLRVRRKLRSLAQQLVFTGAGIVVTAPGPADVPAELRDDAVVIELPLPGEDLLREELDTLVDGNRALGERLTPHARSRLARAALGLTAAQARRAFAKSAVRGGPLDDRDISRVLEEKKAVIKESRALEFLTPERTVTDVGGLDALKHWLTLRERAFGPEAAAFGLPAPKGLALVGIPGTGKSLTAKTIAGQWRLPLLRLDVGALFGSLVGESEQRIRRALQLAETIAPCVLWVDELEKGFATGDLDGGTSQRVFGTLLTWMQEKTAPVFVVATANDVHALPPETLRRGRFDEVFFLDLPTTEERREILALHLRRRRRDPGAFDLDHLARLGDGYVGAELEQAVVDALYTAFAEGRDIHDKDVAAAMRRTVPLSRSQREVVERLRGWLRDGRAQSASFEEVQLAERAQVRLEFD
ncbi:AAA family ATPase [Streptomyces sp. NPDC051940]|uniref:AAA family ATPase n=1 Tax=Streptomyces sp. NPDC051940 TaxID=3155675 RepID=UPI00342D635C